VLCIQTALWIWGDQPGKPPERWRGLRVFGIEKSVGKLDVTLGSVWRTKQKRKKGYEIAKSCKWINIGEEKNK